MDKSGCGVLVEGSEPIPISWESGEPVPHQLPVRLWGISAFSPLSMASLWHVYIVRFSL